MKDEPILRVVSWNIMHTGADDVVLARVLEAIEQLKVLDADVVLLQEAAIREGVDAPALIADALGMNVAVAVEEWNDNVSSGLKVGPAGSSAILTRLAVVDARRIRFKSKPAACFPVAHLSAPSGRSVIVSSVHLSWGGDNEPARLGQAIDLDDFLGTYAGRIASVVGHAPVVVLGGDFNCEDTSDTYRLLSGQSAVWGHGAYWVDAWHVGEGPGATLQPNRSAWARETALRNGIAHPERLLDRRIDFILVRGWAYGRPGCPLVTRVFGDENLTGVDASDHWGLVTDLADPDL